MIKDIKQISTKKGDKGTSVSYDNVTYSKDDILFETLGTIDELSSTLALVLHSSKFIELKVVQRTLQDIMSLIATFDTDRRSRLNKIDDQTTTDLEEVEKKYLKFAEIGNAFVLPGSESMRSAYLDISRTKARKAERRLVTFINKYERTDLTSCLKYLNRLSDLLFIMARMK